MMSRSTDFLNIAMGKVGLPFVGPAPSGFDTASLVSLAAGVVGITLPDTSQDIYALCASKATLLGPDIAKYMRGALLFEGLTGNRYVVISCGNGEVIEARKHTYTVSDFAADGRAWSIAALIPGMEY